MRRLIGPGLATLVMLVVLCGLGDWQLHRLVWKRGILAAIDRAEISPAIPLPDHPVSFQKVGVVGTFRPDLGVVYGADVRDTPQGPKMGGDLIQPLFRAAGPPVLIDRGWVPEKTDLPIATPSGEISIEGYLREPDHPHLFSAKDNPAQRRFYTLDPAAMGPALGLRQVAPFTLVVLAAGPQSGYPSAATDFPRPPNDHLNYAITWFGLATTLVVVFAMWARKTLRMRE